MIFGIASYHRPQCKTYRFLRKIGISNSDILIGLNDEDDYELYKRNYPESNIVVRKGFSAAFNRNTLLQEINAPCVLLDDDISGIQILREKKKGKNPYFTNATVEELKGCIEKCFEESRKNNAKIFGASPNNRGSDADKRLQRWGGFTPDVMIQGTITGIVDKNVRYNELFRMVEDYELSCRVIQENFHTLRCNYLSAEKPTNGTNEGGLHDLYERGEQPYWIDKLCSKYADIVRPNKNKTGVYTNI